jgi:tetratricopeptide (TPR) repeat protein
MKKALFLFIGSFIIFSCKGYCQEREDEQRQKVDFTVESKSGTLIKVAGWSRVEKKAGKVWEQSKQSAGYNYLIGHSREYSFKSMQTFRLTGEGKIFYALRVQRPKFKKSNDYTGNKMENDTLQIAGNIVDYFFFSESSLIRLKNIVNTADGKSYMVTGIKYYKTVSSDKAWDYPEITMNDKELRTIFHTAQGTIERYANHCEGDSLFVINSQILKGDTVVRFNILSDISSGSDMLFSLLHLDDSYFEVSKHDFTRLYNFTPYVTTQNFQKAKAYLKSGIEKDKLKDYTGAIADYSKALGIDPGYAEAYCKRGLSEIESGQHSTGCNDLKKAAELGFNKANEAIKEKCQ